MTADYDIHVDWAGDGSFDGVGDDISARVLDRGTPFTLQYGREQARAFAPLAGGRGQFELNNSSRDYSPENDSSPLAGSMQPGRSVRIQATSGATTYGLLRGHLDDYDVLPDLERQSVQIAVLDGLARLKNVQVSTELYWGLRTGDAISRLLDAAGWTGGRDIDPGASTIPWWWLEGGDAFAALQKILDAEGPGCLATIGIDGAFVFRDRHHRLIRTASTTAQATFRDGGTEPCYSALVYDHGWKDIVNTVSFSIPVRVPAGELAQVWQVSGQRVIADGETILLSAQSSTPFMSAVAPESGIDFTTLSGVVTTSLSRTSGGSATVFVRAVGGPALIDGMALRAYPIATESTVQVTAEDSTSVEKYGPRSWPAGREPDLASLPDAIAIADVILAARAERLPVVTLTFKGGVPQRMVQQLGRDLSDRVRIVDSGTGLDADFWLEQIAHTIGEDHVTTFGLEKIPTPSTGLLILDDATLGRLDVGKLAGLGLSDASTVFVLDDAVLGKLGVGLLGY